MLDYQGVSGKLSGIAPGRSAPNLQVNTPEDSRSQLPRPNEVLRSDEQADGRHGVLQREGRHRDHRKAVRKPDGAARRRCSEGDVLTRAGHEVEVGRRMRS